MLVPQMYMFTLNFQGDGVTRWCLWEVMRVEPPKNGASALILETPESPLTPSSDAVKRHPP